MSEKISSIQTLKLYYNVCEIFLDSILVNGEKNLDYIKTYVGFEWW